MTGAKTAIEFSHYVVGALSFTGKVQDAKSLFDKHEPQLSFDELVACRFFLGVGYTRISEYIPAETLFSKNLASIRSHTSTNIARFYAFQGVGFYRYFSGRIISSKKFADRAYQEALEERFTYGLALAEDLRGHTSVLTGEVSEGFSQFENAKKHAENISSTGLIQAIDVTMTNFKAYFGSDFKQTISFLKQFLKHPNWSDSYSQISLFLELCRQLTLRGRLIEAEEILAEAFKLIYQVKHKRYEIQMNLRHAEILYKRNDLTNSLNLIVNSQKAIDKRVDIQLLVKVKGMEAKLQKALGLHSDYQTTILDLKALTQRHGGAEAFRYLARVFDEKNYSPWKRYQDPVGDIVDDVTWGSKTASKVIVQKGLLSLLPLAWNNAKDRRAIIFDLLPNSVLVFDQGEAVHYPNIGSKLFRQLTAKIAAGFSTKEELIHEIWGYKYSPLKHDSLVYTAIANLRKALGKMSYLLESDESGYKWADRVEIRFSHIKTVSRIKKNEPPIPGQSSQLNYRQLKCLEQLISREFEDVSNYQKLFDVSRATATRDLTDLTNKGYLKKLGKGRATKYVLPRSKV